MVGITNNGDPTMDLSWINKVDTVDLVVLTTKNAGALINSEIEPVIEKIKDKLIIEVSVTGYGKTAMEPNSPPTLVSAMMINELLKKGYNVIVRIDPIILTQRGLDKAKSVIDDLRKYMPNTLLNIRYGLLTEFEHFKNRVISITPDIISEDDVHNYFKNLEETTQTIVVIEDKFINKVELLETPEQCYFRCAYCCHEKDHDIYKDAIS